SRPGDDRLGARRLARRRAGPQARPAAPLRQPGALPRRHARGAGGGARPAWQSRAGNPRAAEQDELMGTGTDERGRDPEPSGADRAPPAAGGEEKAGDVTMVVITGHSGAGKSEAIAAFEDGG